MAKTDLLKEAIADAKAVRETALANAKIALEEAFTPRIQSMLSAKLSEDDMGDDTDMTDDMPADSAMEEGEHEDAKETNGDGMDTAAGAPVDEGEHEDDKMDEGEHEEDGMDEDLELEAILKELEEGEDDDKMDEGEKEEMDEQSGSSDIGKGDNKVDVADGSDEEDPGKGKLVAETKDEKDDMDEDINLDEIIEALKEEEEDKMDEGEDDEKNENYTAGVDDGAASKDLEEAYNVIKFLKSKINEVNLLNAKLLFSNKLFRNHSLNENQKMKVIENFDRAQSLREVKLVFATLSESFTMNGQKTKRTIKESYASKPSKSTAPKKEVISEGNQLAARWKKLANL